MANYTFTSISGYAIRSHSFAFTSTEVTIRLISTGAVVFQKDFTAGMAFMCKNGEFNVGTLEDDGIFSRKVDFNKPKAKLWFGQNSGGNTFWGSNNYDDPSVFNSYKLDDCPIRLSGSGNIVTMECPCESDSGTCDNSCYKYG